MQQSSSADTLSAVAAGRLTRWPAFPYGVWVRLSLWLSVTVVAVLFAPLGSPLLSLRHQNAGRMGFLPGF